MPALVAVAPTGASCETCRTPPTEEAVVDEPALVTLAMATTSGGIVPGSVCRDMLDMIISPDVASNRVTSRNSRCGPPTSSQGIHTL